MKFNLIKIPKIVLLLPLSLMVASCETNFENIEEFGLSSAIVREKSANMADDIYQSCPRRNKYTTKRFPESLETLYINLPLKPEENQATPVENNEPLEWMDSRNNCQDSKQQSQIFYALNLILIDYMVALGKLASNETINFDRELQNFQKSLNESNDVLVLDSDTERKELLDREKLNAGLKIARFVFNQLTAKFQRDNLHEAILCTNDSIQEYIPGLWSLTEDFYLNGIIRSEKEEIESHYDKYNHVRNLTWIEDRKFEEELTPEEKTQLMILNTQLTIADLALEQDYIAILNDLDRKIEAANAYKKILDATANTHQKLFEEFNQSKMSTQEVEAFCNSYFAESEEETLSQTNSLSYPQLKRVEQIVMDYTNEVKPHLKKLNNTF